MFRTTYRPHDFLESADGSISHAQLINPQFYHSVLAPLCDVACLIWNAPRKSALRYATATTLRTSSRE